VRVSFLFVFVHVVLVIIFLSEGHKALM